MTKLKPDEVERFCAEQLELILPGQRKLPHSEAADFVKLVAQSALNWFNPMIGRLDEDELRLIAAAARTVVHERMAWLVTLRTLCGCSRHLSLQSTPREYEVPVYADVGPSDFGQAAALTPQSACRTRTFVLRRRDVETKTADYEERP